MTTFTTEDREDAERKPMNANELAVYLEDITDWEESPYRQAATMLRQQQANIEELDHVRINMLTKIGILKEEIAEMQRLFNKAMDEWAKDKSK
jgi:hypothetical protein